MCCRQGSSAPPLRFAGESSQDEETGRLQNAVRLAGTATGGAGVGGGLHDAGGAGRYHALPPLSQPPLADRRRAGAAASGIDVALGERAAAMRPPASLHFLSRHADFNAMSRYSSRRARRCGLLDVRAALRFSPRPPLRGHCTRLREGRRYRPTIRRASRRSSTGQALLTMPNSRR